MARTRRVAEDVVEGIPGQFAITRRRTLSKIPPIRAAGTAAAASAAAQGSRFSVRRMISKESSRRPSEDATPWMTANESIGSCTSIESPRSTNGGSDMEMTLSSSSKMSGGAARGSWSPSASASTTPTSQMSASGADMFRERGASKDSCRANSRQPSKESCSPISRQTSKDSCRSSLLQLPSISPAFGSRAPSKESRSASKESTVSQTRSGFKGGLSAPRRNTLNVPAMLDPTAGASLTQEPASIVEPSGDMDMEKKRLVGQIQRSRVRAEFEQIFSEAELCEQIFSEAEVREWRIRMSSGEDWQKRLPGERMVTFSELQAKELELREARAELKAELDQDRAQADLDWDELEDGEPADGDSKRFRKKATIIVAANDDDFENDIDKKGPVVGAVVSRVRSKLSAMITMSEELRQPLAAYQAAPCCSEELRQPLAAYQAR